MSGWLSKDVLVVTLKAVTTADPRGIECMKQRPDDPIGYMDFMSVALRFIGESVVKKFGESDKFLTRKKDNEVSRKLREEGNKVYLADDKIVYYEEEALELYTKSIAYAIPRSQEMAKGFANRSAVLLRLERPVECLEDIASALNFNYPEELTPKLLIRKAECFSMLAEHSYIHAKFWLSKVSAEDPCLKEMETVPEGHSARDYARISDGEEPLLPEIKSVNAKFPCASDAIEYSGPAERKIVATRDIRVGEVLIVEKPYLTYPLEENHYCYCTFCLKSFWTGIPCDSCPNVVYCSEECKDSAWREFHSLECPVMNLLLQNLQNDIDKLWVYTTASVRLLIKFFYEAGGLMALRERIREFRKQRVLQGEWYKTQTLESVLALNDHIESISTESFQKLAARTIQILFHLATNTDFFGIQYQRNCMTDDVILLELSKNNDVQFVGGLLMKLLLISRYQSSDALDTICKVTYVHATLRNRILIPDNSRGIKVPAFSQLITTSCYFNTTEQYVGRYVIFHSIIPIKKGEELRKALFPRSTWTKLPKEIRNSESGILAGINCSCRACDENWPPLNQLDSFEVRAKSSLYRFMLEDILRPLPTLHDVICEKQKAVGRVEHDEILSTLGRMMKAIYDGVHLPCKEQALILNTLTAFYRLSGMTSRWNNKHLGQVDSYSSVSSYF